MDVLLFGIQGSGKGTQAKIIAQKHGYTIFEAGSALREIAHTDSDLGRTVASYIDSGHLVPFEIIMDVVGTAVQTVGDRPMLFDGIPRDADQQKAFDRLMSEHGRDFRCIHLSLTDAVAMERIRKRAEMENRADDLSEEYVQRRIALFHEKTEPVISLYRSRGIVHDIDANASVDSIAESISTLISGFHS